MRLGEFWAVKDVSFELKRGECIGLIGHNGAGKTTLLKMLNGLIKPDSGRIEMSGKAGALIALGAGFNPVLTGRENIFINGAVLGLSKNEITNKIDEICDFAKIGDFIDSPVQNYSSGMQVRLGFSVAASLNPDILILDEVLAVGDSEFRSKCLRKISTLLSKCAVIFVSHSESQIRRISTKTLLLDSGKVAFQGDANDAYSIYNARKKFAEKNIQNADHFRIQLEGVESYPAKTSFLQNQILVIRFRSDEIIVIDLVVIGFRYNGEFCAQAWSRQELEITPRGVTVKVDLFNIPLADGEYELTLSAFSDSGRVLEYYSDDLQRITIFGRGCFQVRTQVEMKICEIEGTDSSML